MKKGVRLTPFILELNKHLHKATLMNERQLRLIQRLYRSVPADLNSSLPTHIVSGSRIDCGQP